ncbi:hypothetical protein ACFVZ3_36190 [Kitasatospora purpeofusca]|uniref:hypothetical protein n=1 Tax=Kitasatospora purpeofusca TaxID=67352 RepID=UPI0036A92A18
MVSPGDISSLRLPIEHYLPTPAQNAEMEHAVWILAERCMERRGFSFAAPPMLSHQRSDGEIRKRYGPSDLNEAQQYGYHDSPNPDRNLPKPKPLSDLPEPEFLALTGQSKKVQEKGKAALPPGAAAPPGGCLSEAQEKSVSGGHPYSSELARKIDTDSHSASAGGPRGAEIESAWSACMKDRGYRYSTHIEAYSDERWGRSPTPDSLEISVAVADVECKQETNFIGVWYSVESEFQKQQIDQHREQLENDRINLQHKLAVAAGAIAGSQPSATGAVP